MSNHGDSTLGTRRYPLRTSLGECFRLSGVFTDWASEPGSLNTLLRANSSIPVAAACRAAESHAGRVDYRTCACAARTL